MKKQIDNILKHKTLPCLPQESGFYSGDCPGAAAITILSSLFSSLRGTFGSANPDGASRSVRVGTTDKPGKEKENKEHRITNNEYRISNNEGGSQKSEVRSSSGTPVSDFLFLISYFLFPGKGKENKEHRITNNEYRISNIEYRIRKAEDGIRNLTSNDTSTSFLSPSPFGEGRGEANNEYRIRKAEDGIRNLTSNDTSTSFLSPFRRLADGWGETKYKTLSRLPQESGFNSGDCPGAAAITIFYSFYSSLRVSPNFAGTTQKNLPVANQQAFHQGSIVPLFRGTSPGYPGRRGYLPFHRNLMFEALYQKGGTPMS